MWLMWQRIVLVTVALVLVVLVATFGHNFFANRQIAFRDASHFYYPLHQTLKTQGQGEVWRESLIANPTSGVFYPITWLLLAFPTPFDEHLIVLVHLIIAVVTARRLARSLRVSPLAATFAGIVYAASGGVLFQMHNIIFLIGAAWLPEAVRLMLSLRQRHRLRNTVWLSTVVSLMVFGGDIQAVAHLALFGLVLIVWDFILSRELRFLSLIAVTALVVVLVTSVQWVPTVSATLQSDRFSNDHIARIDLYRVPLFRLIEFIYPHFSGMPYPQHTRWTMAAESHGIWTPSLYAGVIPAVLVILSMRLWGKTRMVALTWCLLVACVAAMGRDFGVYSLLEMIPGYGLFRYPAKWITVASLPFALLAAIGLDTVISAKNNSRFFCTALAIAACLFLAMQLVLWSGAMEAAVPPCPLFGVFQHEAALQQFIVGGVFGISLLLIAAILTRFTLPRKLPLGLILVILTGLDVAVMNAPLVITASRESFDIARAKPLQRIITAHTPSDSVCPPRLFRIVCEPPEWRETSSHTRIDEWIARDIATLAPRYHWLLPSTNRIDILPASGTFMPREVASQLHRTEGGWWMPNDWQSVKQLGIDFFLVSDTIALPEAWLTHLERVGSDQHKLPPGVTLWRVRDALRRNEYSQTR